MPLKAEVKAAAERVRRKRATYLVASGALEMLRALRAILAYDARMMAAGRAPDGADYNEVISIVMTIRLPPDEAAQK
jgi:hypothetical protein